MDPSMILMAVVGLAVLVGLIVFILMTKRTAYLGPVKEELQKEKMWLRRGEYNAAMVKGRQNLELLLKLVAEKNGIQLDNSAKAQADAKEEMERKNGQQAGQVRGKRSGGNRQKPMVMTHQQFSHWMSANGYLDRVARWEMNQVRVIGNKAAHENYADKDEAWNQLKYLEDILKTVTEKSQNPKKRQEQSKRNDHAETHVKVKQKKRGGAGTKTQKDSVGKSEPEKKAKKDSVGKSEPEKKAKKDTGRKPEPEKRATKDAGKKSEPEKRATKDAGKKLKPEKKMSKDAGQKTNVEKKVQKDAGQKPEPENKVKKGSGNKGMAEQKTADGNKRKENTNQEPKKLPKKAPQPKMEPKNSAEMHTISAEVKTKAEEISKAVALQNEEIIVKKKRRRRRKKSHQVMEHALLETAKEVPESGSSAVDAAKEIPSSKSAVTEKNTAEEKTVSADRPKRRRRRRKSRNRQAGNVDSSTNAGAGDSSGE